MSGITVGNVEEAMERIAPTAHAAEWDRVGLLLGSRNWQADRILLTIDLTDDVLHEALATRAGLVIAYHPPIFEPLNRVTDGSPKQRIILEAARNGIAIYSPHTALDAAPGGLNDWLAEGLGTGDVRALVSQAVLPPSEQCKIVTFCPEDAAERIRNGLATVGCGEIGVYRLCSFETRGFGTFLAPHGAKPAVGSVGSLERVNEVRLEMVCPRRVLGLAVMALREFHPYEEPPIEIYALEPRPDRAIGMGRRVQLDHEADLPTLVTRIKQRLSVRHLWVADGANAPRTYGRVAVCAGSGGSLVHEALAQECRLFLTGEMRHHDVLAAQAAGCTIVLAGHTNTERGYLPVLAQRLGDALPAATTTVSTRDVDPLRVI